MISITLPDNSVRTYDAPLTAMAVAEDISPGLARVAVAARVDGDIVDLSTMLDSDHTLALLTNRDAESLEILRHTAAHVLAQAMQNLYGQEVQYTIGPALMDDFQYGFYYDFDLPDNVSLSADDLPTIEAEMKRLVKAKLPLTRKDMSADEAKALFAELGQRYKGEMIDELDGPSISAYSQGEFTDMCVGPHLPTTGGLGKAFKLLTVAGAYWRGDENRKMLTRIYGVAFFDKKELAAHLERVEEARKRDHRVLGKQLGLFLLDEKVGPGLPIWLPNGEVIRQELQGWIREQLLSRGYKMVSTPHIGKLDLWRTSGHYPYYKDSQFPAIQFAGQDEDGEGFLLKPMNCPAHLRIYKAGQHSYRDLPLRLAEFGQVYRWEQSGELNGLTRVRSFTQDDAHIFCTPDQLESEVESCVSLAELVLRTLGLNDYRVRISLRDPDSDKYVGSDENWELAENNLRNVVQKLGMNYTEEVGEAAFYGPKIDFVVNDCLGREWQLGTIQVDYNLPERFELEYIGADNHPHQPVMIHRAPFGSFERFIGILIEHYAGAFPLWLAPVQVAVLPVSEKFDDYARSVQERLLAEGIRVETDLASDKIGAKIRRSTLQKVPYMVIVGQQESDADTVAVRRRTEGDLGAMPVESFIKECIAERDTRGSHPLTV